MHSVVKLKLPNSNQADLRGTASENAKVSLEEVGAGVTVPVSAPSANTSATSDVPDSTSTVTLLAANANRLGAFVYNASGGILYAKLGSGATLADWTKKVFPDELWTVPEVWRGIITGIWDVDTGGSAKVTELTP